MPAIGKPTQQLITFGKAVLRTTVKTVPALALVGGAWMYAQSTGSDYHTGLSFLSDPNVWRGLSFGGAALSGYLKSDVTVGAGLTGLIATTAAAIETAATTGDLPGRVLGGHALYGFGSSGLLYGAGYGIRTYIDSQLLPALAPQRT